MALGFVFVFMLVLGLVFGHGHGHGHGLGLGLWKNDLVRPGPRNSLSLLSMDKLDA